MEAVEGTTAAVNLSILPKTVIPAPVEPFFFGVNVEPYDLWVVFILF